MKNAGIINHYFSDEIDYRGNEILPKKVINTTNFKGLSALCSFFTVTELVVFKQKELILKSKIKNIEKGEYVAESEISVIKSVNSNHIHTQITNWNFSTLDGLHCMEIFIDEEKIQEFYYQVKKIINI